MSGLRVFNAFVLPLGLLVGCAALGPERAPAASIAPLPRDGVAQWIDTTGGRLKTRAYSSETLSAHPTLIIVIHGDIPIPRQDQYILAELFAEGDAPEPVIEQIRGAFGDALPDYLLAADPPTDIVAVGLLRPGYADNEGDTSAGEQGMALADNYTPEVIDAVADAVAQLKAQYAARAVILVGHSGGAAISADLLGRHPDGVDGALLIACGCDPVAWREIARAGPFASFNWDHPYRSLAPMDLVSEVATDTKVRMVRGANDDNVPPEHTAVYAQALEARGIDVEAVLEPGFGHDNIVFTPLVFDMLKALIDDVR